MRTARLSVLGPRYVLPGKSTQRFVHIKTFGFDCYFQMARGGSYNKCTATHNVNSLENK